MDQAIRFTCPTCERRLKVKLQAAGKFIDCPKCAARLRIPDAPEDAPRNQKNNDAQTCYFCSTSPTEDSLEVDLVRPKPEEPGQRQDFVVEIPRCGTCGFVHQQLWWWLAVPLSLGTLVLIFALGLSILESPLNDLSRHLERSFGKLTPLLFIGTFLAVSVLVGTAMGSLGQRLIQNARGIKARRTLLTYPEVRNMLAQGWRLSAWGLDFTLTSLGGFGLMLVLLSFPAMFFGGLVPTTLMIAGLVGLVLAILGIFPGRGRAAGIAGVLLFLLRIVLQAILGIR